MPLPRPPPADTLVALADQCVQCGLCLPACPTYRRDRIEAESPRGRIALARGWALDALEPTAAGDAHLDNCLACRSCEAVCPAGVEYGALLVEARRRQRGRRGTGRMQKAIEGLVSRPALLRGALTIYRSVWPLLGSRLRPLPRPPALAARRPSSPAASARPAVHVFVGCVASTYEAGTRASLARLLDACGLHVRIPDGQGCCGAMHRHAGNAPGARALEERNASAFAGAMSVVTLASGCHEAVAAAMEVPVQDALDVLAAHVARLRFRRTDERIALHLPCTQRNVVRSAGSLHKLLATVPGIDIVPLDEGHGCCGAAGSAMLTDTARAVSFRAPLLEQLERSGATRVISANIGCRLNLANGTTLPVEHPIDFLAAHLDAPQ